MARVGHGLAEAGIFPESRCLPCFLRRYVMGLYRHLERSKGTAWMIALDSSNGIVAVVSVSLERDTGSSIGMAFARLGALAGSIYASLSSKET